MMKTIQKLCLCVLITLAGTASLAASEPLNVTSPDGKITATVTLGEDIRYSLSYQGRELVKPSPLALVLEKERLGAHPVLAKATRREVRDTLEAKLYKKSRLEERYNELKLAFEGGYALVFRAYDEGLAFRWETSKPGELTIRDEVFICSFDENPTATMLEGHFHQYESLYRKANIETLADFEGGALTTAALPTVLEFKQGPKLAIAESDLLNYPALYLTYDLSYPHALIGKFPKYPRREAPGGFHDFDLRVTEEENFIARTEGTRTYPWRIFIVAPRDADLLNSDLVYLLARPPEAGADYSWVKPGKVAWDFWISWNLQDVDFPTGINTATFKYFIDFAARHHIEYVNLDWLWSDPHDLTRMNPNVDVPYLIRYAKSKGVGITLWCLARTLAAQMPQIMDVFEKWGVAGLKIDFFDRDDQKMVELYERFARAAAQRKMAIDFHGATPPSGFIRTYPNVLNFEAVRGMEYDKFNDQGTPPDHDVNLAFLRMLAGPMDYTPGAMRNANKANWKPIPDLPMSQGTRCHQLALYVLCEMPLAMLSDMPTAYEREPAIMKFLEQVPTVWDETVALDGELGEFAVLARRTGERWYVGAINSWNPRRVTVDLGFLPAGNYQATLYVDGVNADKTATDYQELTKTVSNTTKLDLDLKPGGGAVVVLSKAE